MVFQVWRPAADVKTVPPAEFAVGAAKYFVVLDRFPGR